MRKHIKTATHLDNASAKRSRKFKRPHHIEDHQSVSSSISNSTYEVGSAEHFLPITDPIDDTEIFEGEQFTVGGSFENLEVGNLEGFLEGLDCEGGQEHGNELESDWELEEESEGEGEY